MISFLNATSTLSEQLIFTLSILCLVIVLTALWQGMSLTIYKKTNQQLSFNLVRSKLLLDAAEGAWCSWGTVWGKPIPFFHSQYFSTIFNLNPRSLLELSPIFELLQEDSQKKLQIKISLLHSDQIPFQIELILIDFKKLFARGSYFEDEGIALNTLWFREADLMVEEEQRVLIRESFKLKNLMDILPFPTWIRDEHFQITYANKAYAALLDVTPEEVVHESLEISNWTDKSDIHKFSREIAQKATPLTKRFFTIIQGNRHIMEVSEFPVQHAGVHGGYAVDITREEELKEKFDRYKQVEKNVLDSLLNTAVAIFSADTRLRTYNEAYVTTCKLNEDWLQTNPTLSEILEVLREKRQLPEVMDFKDYKAKRLDMFNTLTEPLEEIQHKPDGKILRIVHSPHPLGGLILTLEDVTSYLRLESDLRVMLAVYRATIDHLSEGVLLFGTDNRVILSNPALGLLWNLTEEQRKLGKHLTHVIEEIRDLLPQPADWQEYKNHVLDNISDRTPKIRLIHLTNSNIYQLSYIPLPDGSNLIIFLDVTAKYKNEENFNFLEG